MKIAQIVVPGASEYERKSQRVDFAALSEAGHRVAVYSDAREARDADIAHVYGQAKRIRMPHVIDAELQFPEAVEERYWTTNDQQRTTPALSVADGKLLGTYARKSIKNAIELCYARLSRTRDDIEWRLFERPPAPDELAEIAVWVDPALTD